MAVIKHRSKLNQVLRIPLGDAARISSIALLLIDAYTSRDRSGEFVTVFSYLILKLHGLGRDLLSITKFVSIEWDCLIFQITIALPLFLLTVSCTNQRVQLVYLRLVGSSPLAAGNVCCATFQNDRTQTTRTPTRP